jgi:hypothetical protein
LGDRDRFDEVMTMKQPRLMRWVRIGVTTATFVVAPPGLEAQTGQPGAPTVFIEAFRSTDTVGRAIAASLREALAKSVSPTRLAVISTATIDANRNSGAADDFMGGAWVWGDLRLSAWVFRATCVVDLLATPSRHGIAVRVARLCSPFHGDPETLAPVTAPTVDAAVAILADRLASDSALFVVPLPPPPRVLPPVDSAQLGGYRVRVKDSESGRFLAMHYVLLTPPKSALYANMHTTATADGWGPIGYENPGKRAIELDALVCGTQNWSLANPQRKPFVVARGELTSIELVVRKSRLKMAKAYYNPNGDPCPDQRQ